MSSPACSGYPVPNSFQGFRNRSSVFEDEKRDSQVYLSSLDGADTDTTTDLLPKLTPNKRRRALFGAQILSLDRKAEWICSVLVIGCCCIFFVGLLAAGLAGVVAVTATSADDAIVLPDEKTVVDGGEGDSTTVSSTTTMTYTVTDDSRLEYDSIDREPEDDSHSTVLVPDEESSSFSSDDFEEPVAPSTTTIEGTYSYNTEYDDWVSGETVSGTHMLNYIAGPFFNQDDCFNFMCNEHNVRCQGVVWVNNTPESRNPHGGIGFCYTLTNIEGNSRTSMPGSSFKLKKEDWLGRVFNWLKEDVSFVASGHVRFQYPDVVQIDPSTGSA